MLGLGDWGVSLAFLLTLGSTAFCVIYGLLNWNKPGLEEDIREIAKKDEWEKREIP